MRIVLDVLIKRALIAHCEIVKGGLQAAGLKILPFRLLSEELAD